MLHQGPTSKKDGPREDSDKRNEVQHREQDRSHEDDRRRGRKVPLSFGRRHSQIVQHSRLARHGGQQERCGKERNH